MSKILKIAAIILVIILFFILFLPKIASSPLGKPFFIRPLESRTSGKVEIKALNLSWFGPQTFQQIRWTQDEIVGTVDKLTIDAPFWSFSGPFHLENGSIGDETEETTITVSLKGLLAPDAITLTESMTAEVQLTPFLSTILLKDANPLFLTAISGSNPVIITLSSLSIPRPFTFEKLTAAGTLSLGQIQCQNGKTLAAIVSLFNVPQPEQMSGWFSPVSFQLNQGVIETGRMDALLAGQIHVCTWGKINVAKDQVRMFLGLPADALERYFGIDNLDDNFVLPLPIRGTTKNPVIDKKKALAQIAKAIFFKPKGVPPANRPFPWER